MLFPELVLPHSHIESLWKHGGPVACVGGLCVMFSFILPQNATLQTATNGQLPLPAAADGVQLKCNYCRGAFSMKPETLEWEVRPPFLFKREAKMHNG